MLKVKLAKRGGWKGRYHGGLGGGA